MKRIVLALAVIGVIAGCASTSNDPNGHRTATTTGSKSTAASAGRPVGPAATFSGPLTGGGGIDLLSASPGPSLANAGYSEAEYAASGTATAYTAPNLPTDGNWHLKPGSTASYATRVVVRRPTNPKAFNGTVVVEWLNVSSGADAAPDYTYLAAELLRRGYAWVGVSAQEIGIEGGPVAVAAPGAALTGAGKGIRAFDPARYSQLHHPGDAYSYDIYTQVARALRTPTGLDPMSGLHPKQLLAVGESQSAFALTTYYDGVQPLTREFDGFLIHSRGGAPAPLGEPGKGIDITGTLGGAPTKFRTDVAAPVIVAETETDVLGLLDYYPAIQPDNARLRLWEMAGTSHADKIQVGDAESLLGCSVPINRGQQGYVLRSALRDLNTWAAGGAAPPHAPRFDIDTSGAKPTYALDANGNVLGGVRTPAVDAPVAALSGIAPANSSVICLLFGSTIPLSSARLTALYPSQADYLSDYTRAADAAIRAGFVLQDDRAALLAEAQPNVIPTKS